MQTIAQATLDQFQNALGLARRTGGVRPGQIDDAVSPTSEIVSSVANTFWALNQHLMADAHKDKLAEFYSTRCRIRLTYGETPEHAANPMGGYIVLDGALLALHNLEKGKGRWLLDHAIADGATHLDCFDVPGLRQLYESRGFRTVRREQNTIPGEPDVIWMELK